MQIEGTKVYLSPEMLEGFVNSNDDSIKVNPFKADAFSFGIILLELILLQRLRNKPQYLSEDKQRLFQELENMRNSMEDMKEFEKGLFRVHDRHS